MKTIIMMILLGISTQSFAGTLNPCEYMNVNAEKMSQLDTGNDASFRAQMQYRNREMVTACQDYQIKVLNNMKNNINKDRSDGYTGYQQEF